MGGRGPLFAKRGLPFSECRVRYDGTNVKHRKDIDGLRSLAVVPVILSHAKLPFLSGGFVGVDIFFVISGFLISDIIYNDIRLKKFSVLNFYERRARRIVPALALIMLFSLVAGYITMLPDDFENTSQSVIATLLFSNNVLLTITSGYWDIGSDFKPLLHTWSLGVEEQYYFIYPLVLMILLRLKPKLFPYFLVVGIIISFAASVILTPIYSNSSFYLLHTRAWELLLGALAAYAFTRTSLPDRANNFLSSAGLTLVFASILLFSDKLQYPSYYALLPCTGTALILLFTRPGTWASRLLSTRLLIGIGLISYSAYLWHQPLFAYARIMSINPPTQLLMVSLCAVTFPLAYLTWRYVEQPFRDRTRVSSRFIFLFTVASTAVLGGAAAFVYLTAGIPERVPGIGLGHANHIKYNERIFSYKKDAFQTDKPRLLIVGSSTARDLTNMMIESGRFRDYEIIYRDDVTICNNDILRQDHGSLIADASAVVWAASYLPDDRCRFIKANAAPLNGKPFILVGPKHFGYNLNAYIFTAPKNRPSVRASLMAETVAANEVHRRLVPAVHYVDLLKAMNTRYGGVPVFDAQGRILSADRVHVTEAGAKVFAGFVFDDPAWKSIFDLDKGRRSLPPPL
jgi:peptidoglycan/LPS O-acetylase OafA/YrhL